MSNFIYARKAVESPMEVGVQVQACKQYAEEKVINVKEIFIDDGFSGIDENRPSYK